MNHEEIESTYLKAKNAASDAGFTQAAGEFRVKRQQYAQKKHFNLARNSDLHWSSRLKNVSRAVENGFLGVSCGYGMRVGRIGVVFAIFPLIPALFYTVGGRMFATTAGTLSSVSQLATPEGLSFFYKMVYFSYVSFLTIGYGDISPTGVFSRFLVGFETYMGVILGGLLLYALVKRSEV